MADQPSSIGRFRILRTLGGGGMGVVYAAFDDRLEREIAVKTIPHVEGDDRSRERFLREARVAASLNHPNVCQVYEVGKEPGRGVLAMELLQGEPLSARLARGSLEAGEAANIATAGIPATRRWPAIRGWTACAASPRSTICWRAPRPDFITRPPPSSRPAGALLGVRSAP